MEMARGKRRACRRRRPRAILGAMIEFACHTWAFSDLTLTEALGTIARLGFRCADIGSGPNLNAPRAAADPQRAAADIKGDLALFNLRLSDLYLLLPRISLADDDKRQKDLDLYRALIPFAQALGAPGITLSPGLAHAADDGDARDRAVAALREMLRLGQDAGLRVSVEPHADSLAQTPDGALRLLKEVPGLALTLDWAQLVAQGAAEADIRTLLPHTRHIQLRQAAKGKPQTPFEGGRIDVARVLDALYHADYRGVVCVEYMSAPGFAPVDTLSESARLRDALRAARDALPQTG